MNKAMFYGRVAGSPVFRGQDKHVLTFRVAVNGRRLNAETGEWTEDVSYFPFVLFGKRAEAIGGFLAKGMPVTIESHARQNTWQTDDGQNRSAVEFVVDDIWVGRNK